MTYNDGNQTAHIESVSSLALPVDFQVLKKTSTTVLGETIKQKTLLFYLKLWLVHLHPQFRNREILTPVSLALIFLLGLGISSLYQYMCPLRKLICRIPCGGGIEYLRRSPASRKRRRKGNPVPGGKSGPTCSWGI
jgi:hypothetical protein